MNHWIVSVTWCGVALILSTTAVMAHDTVGSNSWKPTESFPTPNVTSNAPIQETKKELSWFQKYAISLENRVYSNWEPGSLAFKVPVIVGFSLQPDGTFKRIRLIRASGSAQADFAAIEAVAETSGFDKHVPVDVATDMQIMLRKDDRKYSDCSHYLAEKTDDEVIWHLIPLEALNVTKEVPRSAIHQKENLRLVTQFRDGDAIDSARQEWSEFLHAPVTLDRSSIMRKAAEIQKKFEKRK